MRTSHRAASRCADPQVQRSNQLPCACATKCSPGGGFRGASRDPPNLRFPAIGERLFPRWSNFDSKRVKFVASQATTPTDLSMRPVHVRVETHDFYAQASRPCAHRYASSPPRSAPQHESPVLVAGATQPVPNHNTQKGWIQYKYGKTCLTGNKCPSVRLNWATATTRILRAEDARPPRAL